MRSRSTFSSAIHQFLTQTGDARAATGSYAEARMQTNLCRIILAGAALACAGGPAWAGTIVYTVTDLGTLGGTSSSSDGISSNGTYVTGQSNNGSATHAFSTTGGAMKDLGTLGGNSTGYS